uniref:Chloroplast nucleoid binding protein n=1 Tax=Brachypodium sylvaticum TaxID=29664 RepID=Q2L3E7_BRASY|nr:chloroplast nucleoid binding protein [Brachypodium sylvaticum]
MLIYRSFRPAAASNSSTSAFSVMHRHGPCSPLQTPDDAPSDADLLEHDQARVDSIHRMIANETAVVGQDVSLPAERGISVGTGNYVVSVGLGTPARDLTVVFDTGSDLSWVQCGPCSSGGCYHQQDPLFAPSSSSTFSAVRCGEPECPRARQSCSSSPGDDRCPYEVVYGDKSRTVGHLGNDTLTLGTTPSTNASENNSNKLPGFVFGCGENNTGLFGKADGLFGLGRGKVSLSSQAAGKYGEGFSYCLPSSSSNAHGYLSLGTPAPAPAHARFTPMLNRSNTPSFYYVKLVGIRVAGRAIKVSSRPALWPAGLIVDSGTVITRLAPRAYSALRTAFLSAMGKYGYKRAPRLSILDTCYDFTAHANATVSIPAVALVFAGGATISVDFSGVLYVAKVAQACLAFAPNGNGRSAGILGNTQQRTVAVVYDVGRQKIGFAAKGCS